MATEESCSTGHKYLAHKKISCWWASIGSSSGRVGHRGPAAEDSAEQQFPVNAHSIRYQSSHRDAKHESRFEPAVATIAR